MELSLIFFEFFDSLHEVSPDFSIGYSGERPPGLTQAISDNFIRLATFPSNKQQIIVCWSLYLFILPQKCDNFKRLMIVDFDAVNLIHYDDQLPSKTVIAFTNDL